MKVRLGRAAIVGVAMLAVIAGTALGAGTRIAPGAPTQVSALQYNELGVSGAVAAKALNALAREQAKSSSHALTRVNFILNWVPNVEFAGLWMAQKFGWWTRAGLSVEYTPWSFSVFPATQVPEHPGNTFGFDDSAAIDIARSNGVQIQALFADAQKSVFALTVLEKSHITTLTQLKGKKVGYQGHEFFVPATMLAYAGLKPTDWKPVQVGFDIVQLTAGRVDAYLTFLTNEPISLSLQGVKTRSFAASDYGFHFYGDVLFTTTSLITQNPSLVRKVVTNIAKGFQWAHTHPDVSARYIVKTYFSRGAGETAKIHLEQQILELRAFKNFSRDPSGGYTGLMNTATWNDSINTLFQYNQLKTKPDPATMYTNRFNPYR